MTTIDATDTTFRRAAIAAAIDWKRTTPSLDAAGRADGSYPGYPNLPFCLPHTHRHANLLPDARDLAISRFRAAGIEWHDGHDDLPSTHLLDSQAQCANALAPIVGRPDAIRRLFGRVLPIAEVLPFGATDTSNGARLSPHDETDHLVFEWQGLRDHFGEWSARSRRGSMATSTDAAFRYRTPDGSIEMALVEWKFTERYDKDHLDGSNATRDRRYQSHFSAPDGPIVEGSLGLSDCYADPVYQLMRFTLLARAIERHRELEVERCRIVYVAPGRNRALFASRGTAGFARFAGERHFLEAWRAVMRRPDDLVMFDSARLLDTDAPTGHEFRTRYSVLAHSETEARAGGPLEDTPRQ